MNTPDQLDALRAHLDDALAGIGSNLPGDAAPGLLQTARRRARTKRIAAGAGSAVVAAALVIGVGSQLTSTADRKPSVIGPATAPPSATTNATTNPTTAPSLDATTPVRQAFAKPSVADHAGINISAQRSVDPQYLGQANDEVKTFGNATYILGRGADEDSSAPDTLVKLDLATGDTTTLATNMPGPVGSFTVADGKVYVPEVLHGSRVIATYSADDGALTAGTPIVATGGDAQIENTDVAAVGPDIFVATPGRGGQTNVVTIRPRDATSDNGAPIAVADLEIAGSIGSTAYLTSPTQIFAYSGDRVTATAALPFNGVVTVSAEGIYVTSRSDTGGTDPTHAVTVTLSRLDPRTLRQTATAPETLATGVVTTPGVTAAVVNGILFTTIGTCMTAPTTDVCMQRRDPTTLTLEETVLRVAEAAGDQAGLEQSIDGTSVLAIRSAGGTQEQIDLLGAAPAG